MAQEDGSQGRCVTRAIQVTHDGKYEHQKNVLFKQCGFKIYTLETLLNAQAYRAIYSGWCVLYQDFYSNKGTVCKVSGIEMETRLVYFKLSYSVLTLNVISETSLI